MKRKFDGKMTRNRYIQVRKLNELGMDAQKIVKFLGTLNVRTVKIALESDTFEKCRDTINKYSMRIYRKEHSAKNIGIELEKNDYEKEINDIIKRAEQILGTNKVYLVKLSSLESCMLNLTARIETLEKNLQNKHIISITTDGTHKEPA